MFSGNANPTRKFVSLGILLSCPPFSTHTGLPLASPPAGHAAEAKWQVTEQGVEEEVRHPVRQRRADLPPQPTREYGSEVGTGPRPAFM